ncbi:hypothetical protein TrVE_jg1077 [Triparma verrucosa]|uniref:Uncharacterized protein n=1 Tax=Triparma verrucosa TaxID=1606542 RepID=A0A9W7B0H9_9STRA|nr:hypothetical protein TrVE_jg1077 [Triparma verrucosa]
MEEQDMSWFLLTLFRRGVPALVPIVYLSAESLGCLLGETPDFTNPHMSTLEIIESGNSRFMHCVGMISANHAMGFHLSMLLTVSLFVLPFETSMTVQDIKNFNLNLHHQLIFGMIFSSSLIVVYLFATRVESEDVDGEEFKRDLTLINFLINFVHFTWAIAFVSFGFDALAKSKTNREEGGGGAGSSRSLEEQIATENSVIGRFAGLLQKKPFWNRYLGTKGEGKDRFSFAPIYRIIGLLASTVVPISVFLRFVRDDDQGNIIYFFGPSLLALHAALGSLLGLSDVRRQGYPWRELAIFAMNPLTLVLAGLNEIYSSGWTISSLQAFTGAVFLMLGWLLAEKARRMLRDLGDDGVLAKHMNAVFATSGSFMSPILFISLEALNCPVNTLQHGENAAVVCNGIMIPCTAMAFHICAAMTFKANFQPHIRFEASSLMNLEAVPKFRKVQICLAMVATISSMYMYATRAELESGEDSLETLRVLGFALVTFSWSTIFVVQVLAIWSGWETETEVELVEDVVGDEKEGEGDATAVSSTSTVALSKPYLIFFWALILAGSVVYPMIHVFTRNYYSFLVIYSSEVPLLISQVLLFAATPNAHCRRSLAVLCSPYLVFNLLWILAIVIAMAKGEEFATDTADMLLDIGIRLGTILASCLFFPTVVDTSIKLRQFTDGNLETLMLSIFSKFAAGIFLPFLYFTFEASGEIAYYRDSGYSEHRRIEAETSVKTAHSLLFHLMASWSLLLFVFPFKKVATVKELYMFKLSLFSRLQFIAGFIGTACSLLLFAMRWAFAWDVYQQTMLFVVKSTWVAIVLAESWMIKMQSGDRATTNNFGGAELGPDGSAKDEEEDLQEPTMLELMEM